MVNDVPRIYCGGEVTYKCHAIISRSNELLIHWIWVESFPNFLPKPWMNKSYNNVARWKLLCQLQTPKPRVFCANHIHVTLMPSYISGESLAIHYLMQNAGGLLMSPTWMRRSMLQTTYQEINSNQQLILLLLQIKYPLFMINMIYSLMIYERWMGIILSQLM